MPLFFYPKRFFPKTDTRVAIRSIIRTVWMNKLFLKGGVKWSSLGGWGQVGHGVGGVGEDSELVLDDQGLGLSMETTVKKIVEIKVAGEQLPNILEQVKESRFERLIPYGIRTP